ncbi:MAG: hypothetical protein GX785_14805 [Armatimonadetes bacterium]|nr:hypothetical protein [Armatimonadota bacterium]
MGKKRKRRSLRKLVAMLAVALALALCPSPMGIEPPPPPPKPKPKPVDVVIPLPDPPPERKWHPRHQSKTWLTKYRGRIFRTTQLPRCEHVEMLVTYHPAPGVTRAQVKQRTGAIVVCTGSYHHPQTMALADYLQRDGRVLMGRRTQRGILTSDTTKVVDILDEIVRGNEVSALALGSRLVPFKLDGFSVAFANKQTDRMAIGLTKGYIFVVQGVSDLWCLGRFFEEVLGCSKAINADGGHVVKGRGPVHIAFRWRKSPPPQQQSAGKPTTPSPAKAPAAGVPSGTSPNPPATGSPMPVAPAASHARKDAGPSR